MAHIDRWLRFPPGRTAATNPPERHSMNNNILLDLWSKRAGQHDAHFFTQEEAEALSPHALHRVLLLDTARMAAEMSARRQWSEQPADAKQEAPEGLKEVFPDLFGDDARNEAKHKAREAIDLVFQEARDRWKRDLEEEKVLLRYTMLKFDHEPGEDSSCTQLWADVSKVLYSQLNNMLGS